MRILFLAHRLPYPPNKGDKIRSFWELRTLALSHEVDLFCFCDDKKDKSYVEELRRYCHECYVEPISKLRAGALALSGVFRKQPLSIAYFFSETMARRINSAIQSRSYELVLVFSSTMAQYVEQWPDLPRVLDLVDVDSDKWAQYSSSTRGPLSWLWNLESRRLARYESALVSFFNETLVCTDAEAQLLRSKVGKGKISVLQNWLDLDYYDPDSISVPAEIRSLQPYIVFTGTMDYLPNVDAVQFFCREVLPRIREQMPGVRFVIAGRNPTREVLRLGTDSAVRVTGAVPDIRPYLRGAGAAVAPMRIARGVQTKILEALAIGIPVAASSAAARALPQELRQLLFVADKPAALASRLLTYLQGSCDASTSRRATVMHYFDKLNLADQFEGYLRAAAGLQIKAHIPSEGRKEELVPGLG